MGENIHTLLGIEHSGTLPPVIPNADNSTHPLYGIKGWLFFGVVMNLYIGPVLFVLLRVIEWIGIGLASGRYPGLAVVGLYNTFAGGYLVIRAMKVARGFRQHLPRSVQSAKALLWLKVILVLVGIPVSLASGLPPGDLIGGIARSLLTTAVGFAILYSYLSVSKRVAANFPDWKDA